MSVAVPHQFAKGKVHGVQVRQKALIVVSRQAGEKEILRGYWTRLKQRHNAPPPTASIGVLKQLAGFVCAPAHRQFIWRHSKMRPIKRWCTSRCFRFASLGNPARPGSGPEAVNGR